MLRQVIKGMPIMLLIAIGILWWTPALWHQLSDPQATSGETQLFLLRPFPGRPRVYLVGFLLATFDARNRSWLVLANVVLSRRTAPQSSWLSLSRRQPKRSEWHFKPRVVRFDAFCSRRNKRECVT